MDISKETIREKHRLNKLFLFCMILVEVVLILGLIATAMAGRTGELQTSATIAISLMMLWLGIFVAYLAWAMYFFNINMGITNEDWEHIRDKRDVMLARVDNDFHKFSPEEQEAFRNLEPSGNPHAQETFGLPPGTVRGAIAITLLVGAVSLLIFAMGAPDVIKESQFFTQTFDFFTTAFLMMIAFYFGSRSLKYLKGAGTGEEGSPPLGPPVTTSTTTTTTVGTPPASPAAGSGTAAPAETRNALNNLDDEVDDTSPVAGLVVSLERLDEQDDQTLGELTIEMNGAETYSCKTLELPWEDNQKQISCIPQGSYKVTKDTSGSLGNVFRLHDVPGRSGILIHSGNSKDQTKGCILVGKSFADVTGDGLLDVTSSKDTMAELYTKLPSSFNINIA